MFRMSTSGPRFALIALSLLLTLSAVPESALAADGGSWPSFRGADGTGAAVTALPDGDGPLQLAMAWKRPLGSGYSGVSVAGDRLVTAFTDGERDLVIALDAETGDERWRFDLAPMYEGHDGSHDGPIATPAIADDRVFMVAPAGALVALDLASGRSLWRLDVTDDLGSEAPFYGFGGSAVVSGDTVVVQIGGEDGSVAGFDVATGELRWRVIEDEIASQSPIVTTLGGRSQVVVHGAHKLAGIDPQDGDVLWQFDLEGEPGFMGAWTQSPLPIGDDRLLVKFNDDVSRIVSVTSETAEDRVEWRPKLEIETRGLSKSYSPPVAVSSDEGHQIYGYSARFLSALDPSSKDLLWRSREPGDGFLIAIDGQLAVLSKKGSLHLGAASVEGWEETFRLDLFDDLAWTPPSYADGALYARSLGEIARVDLIRGRTRAVAATGEQELPSALAGLASKLETATDSVSLVDRFLADRDLPIIDGNEVTFLWRGGDDVAIAGDMIGMRREEPMIRLPGTDLWWWRTELDSRARISYLFYADYEPQTDPSHDRTVTATVLGPDMNWRRDEAVEMSWFAMPEWPGADDEPATVDNSRGRLETVEVAVQAPPPEGGEQPEPVPVKLNVWLPPGYDETDERYPVVYVHNPATLEAGEWIETLDRVVGNAVAPLIAVFPEPPRMRGFGALFVDQVVRRVDERFRTVDAPTARANIGMGWRGLAATSMSLQHPDTFGLIGVQSMYMLESEQARLESLLAQVGEGDDESLPSMKIYLEWGRWDLISPHEEMNMRASSRRAWQLFKETGWSPVGGEIWDSTDFSSWRHRTDLMLSTLFPGPNARVEQQLRAWRTGS